MSLRQLRWSVRRELWEYPSITRGPALVAAVFLVGYALSCLRLPSRMQAALLEPAKQHAVVVMPYSMAATVVLMTVFAAGFLYCLEALHGERRDRSLLFWKCLADRGEPEPDRPRHDAVGIVATSALVAAPVLLALFAGPAMSAMEATALQLFSPERYIEAVLGSGVDVAGAMP